MSRADEKRAFGSMMNEVDDVDSKPFASYSQPKPVASSRDTVPAKKATMSKEEEEIEKFGSNSRWNQDAKADGKSTADDVSFHKRWLMKPCGSNDPTTLCYVERERMGFGFIQQVYRCYLEPTEGQGPRFLMAAKKMSNKKTSYYLVSLDKNPEDRGSETVLGKVRGNGVGSQYLFTDHGISPDKSVAPSMLRKELGVAQLSFDSGGPSQITAYLPHVNASGMCAVWQSNNEANSMEAKIQEGNLDRLITLGNKKPKWDVAQGGHVLNFQGRVTESSVKNFQLIVTSEGYNDDVVLQFGRVGKDKFSMDVKYPLSIFQAFCICVATMDNKLADRRGYEIFKSLTGDKSSQNQSTGVSKGNGSNANDNDGNNNSNNSASGATLNVSGSLSGSRSLTGMISESMPSTQYLRDKVSRTIK